MKIFDLYKKLTLANFFNGVAMRLFGLSRRFCSKLVSYAIALDPNRDLFKENLAKLVTKNDRFFKKLRKKKIAFYSIPEGCQLLAQKINFIDINQTIPLPLPAVINDAFVVSQQYQCEAKLPDTYLAELHNTTVFAGTDLILAENIALYDELVKNPTERYAIKSPVVEKVLGDKLNLKTPRSSAKNIDCGIHFAKDHSLNYFHWIIECLPRLSLISELDKNIPLLVDAHIQPQAFEALVLINTDNRPVIKLLRNKSYAIKKLYYPSQLSVVHDNYFLPHYEKDAVYSPKAINFVRNTVLQRLNIDAPQPRRKIYLSRKTSHYRQLLNTTEIENFLVTQGFEIIFAENLSFYAQVQLFSEAKIIIGQSGAGMANFIFAPKECNVLMMLNDMPHSNLHLFGAIATVLDLNLEFLLGKTALILPCIPAMHADFHVDINLLANYLEKNGLVI